MVIFNSYVKLPEGTCSNKLHSRWRWREIAEKLAANYARKVSCQHDQEADFKRKMEETRVTIAHIYMYIIAKLAQTLKPIHNSTFDLAEGDPQK